MCVVLRACECVFVVLCCVCVCCVVLRVCVGGVGTCAANRKADGVGWTDNGRETDSWPIETGDRLGVNRLSAALLSLVLYKAS